MNVGIMSMQRVENYGSFLQAYGLKKVLERQGHTVSFVDYKPEPAVVECDNKKANLLGKAKSLIKMLSPSYRRWREKQQLLNRTFGGFLCRYNDVFLGELGITSDRNITPKLDALVIGSDEVFNCTQAGDRVGYSRQLFGKDHRAQKVISYAATFGTTTAEKLHHYGIFDEVSDLLSGFYALSVRDEHSVDMIKQLCGRTPLQHIDPVLLYDFPEIEDISIDKKDYIVVYAYADRLSEEEVSTIRTFAAKHNKTVLSLGYYQSFCDEFILASPLEVLAYIKHADYVVTDTFHGTVFSIKYQKPFATIVRDSNQQKVGGLLKQFDLTERQILNLKDLEKILCMPVSESVCEKIQYEQKQALTYLSTTL